MAVRKSANLKFQLEKTIAKRQIYFSELENLYLLAQDLDDPDNRTSFSASVRLHEERWTKLNKAIETENDLKFQMDPEFTPDYSILTKAEQYRVAILHAESKLTKRSDIAAYTTKIKLPQTVVPEFHGGGGGNLSGACFIKDSAPSFIITRNWMIWPECIIC